LRTTDGGEWAFAIDLFERYGLVPQPLCPESFSSSNSAKMDELVNTKLREYSLELRKLYAHTKQTVLAQTQLTQASAEAAAVSACRIRKTEQLGEIYTVLSMCLGTPPSPNKQFKYEFYDKKGQYHLLETTPLELYKALEPVFKPADNISLVNQPNHELGKLYVMERGHNVYGGRDLLYVNTEIEDLEQAVVKLLKADEPVW
jgi:bleomycin hydrolase